VIQKTGGANHSGASECVRWSFAGVTFDEQTLLLQRAGGRLHLARKPLEVLMFLLRHAGEVVTKDELAENVWTRRVMDDAVITKAVGKLRETLCDRDQEVIETVHCYGYRLVAQVRVETPSSPAPVLRLNLKAGDSPPLRPQWKLERNLGLGGYADVWLARHMHTHALRVFKFAADGPALAALKREVTLYRLIQESIREPPKVVRLHEWNLERAPYFIETDYVSGGSLTDWVAAQGGAEKIELAMRLELVAQVADTLAAVHALGVLHKDLKPSNVLVGVEPDAEPRAWLTDFGSGRVFDQERLKQFGITSLGFTQAIAADASSTTPLYLAPEVVAGQPLTLQADLYALGVILYQFVVGDFRRPLAPGWERDVPDELLREDIAAAADGNPIRRLADAAELARRLRSLDLRRREREQERAGTAAAESLKRQLDRANAVRRWQWAIAAVLLLGLASSYELYQRALAEKQSAVTSAATAQAVNRFVNDELLGAADPYHNGGGKSATVESILRTAAQKRHELDQEQPEVSARLGLTIGRSYYSLSLLDEAREQLQQAMQMSIAAVGSDAPLSQEIRAQLAEVAWKQDRIDESAQLYAAVANSHTADATQLYGARSSLGWIEYMRGHYQACSDIETALLQQAAPGTSIGPGTMADSRWSLAECQLELGQYRQSEASLQQVVMAYEKLLGADNAILDWVALTRGNLLITTEHWNEAEALARTVYSHSATELSDTHSTTLEAQYDLALVQLKRGQVAQAAASLEELYRKQNAVDGEGHHSTRFTMNRLGEAWLRSGRNSEALALLLRAHGLSVAAFGEGHPYSLDIARTLGECLIAEHRYAEAEQLLTRTVELPKGVIPPGNPATGRYLLTLAHLQQVEGHDGNARASAGAALVVFQQTLGEKSMAATAARRAVQIGDYSQLWTT